MAIQAPYRRTVRPFIRDDYEPSDGQMSFVRNPSYSSSPRPYIRGFLALQRDIRSLFEFIHPSDDNLGTYSEHIGVLLVRACFEVETNLKAILRENGYTSTKEYWNMADYKKVERSHRLSQYEAQIPEWVGANDIVRPFKNWSAGGKLDWYEDYHSYKHDRVLNLPKATFRQLISSYCGLFVLLSAQYFLDDFAVEKETVGFADLFSAGDFWHGIGDYLKVKFPTTWPDAEKYAFSLNASNSSDPKFAQGFPY